MFIIIIIIVFIPAYLVSDSTTVCRLHDAGKLIMEQK